MHQKTICSLLQVTVNTNITDLNDYLQHILKSTNMKCLTPEKVGVKQFKFYFKLTGKKKKWYFGFVVGEYLKTLN